MSRTTTVWRSATWACALLSIVALAPAPEFGSLAMEVNPAQPEARAPRVMLLPVSATLAPHARAFVPGPVTGVSGPDRRVSVV